MAWIESHQELGQHPKLKRLARALGVNRVQAVGHLHYLWWWATDYAQSGQLSGFAAWEIADAALWDDDPDAFVAALTETGFLDADGALHDWGEYAGRLIERRAADAERKRSARRKSDPTPTDGAPQDDETTSGGRPADVPTPSVVTVPNRTVPNQTEPPAGETTPQPPTPPKPRAAPKRTPAAPGAVAPSSEPYRLFQALCEETDADEAAASASLKGKQCAIAKRLLVEHDEGQVRRCLRYLRSQHWRTGLIDLGTVESQIGAWVLAGEPATEGAPRAPTPLRGTERRRQQTDDIAAFLAIADGG